MRFDKGVSELELESGSSLARLTAGFVTASCDTGGRVLTTTVSLILLGPGLVFTAEASSSEESEFSTMAAERTRLSFFTTTLGLEGDVFGTLVVLDLELPNSLLACASWAVGFFGFFGSEFELDRDMLSPPARGLSLSGLTASSLEPELSSVFCTLIF